MRERENKRERERKEKREMGMEGPCGRERKRNNREGVECLTVIANEDEMSSVVRTLSGVSS